MRGCGTLTRSHRRRPGLEPGPIQEWNAAGVYQKAIALMGRQIDGGE
jgi:hypothetical protein